MTPDFETEFDPAYGRAVPVAPGILRITAPNAGPFTFRGTNSYLLGEAEPVLVDPGPDEPSQTQTIRAALGGRRLRAILLTHTHRDHTALCARLRAETGAPVLASGPHRAARPLHEGEANPMDAAGDRDVPIDALLSDGERLDLCDLPIEVVATPGHTANHLAFAVGEEGVLLSGDHVMAWSTSVVAPPDGAMRDYMASLDRLLARDDRRYLPGHGGPVERPRPFVRALRSHRRMREAAILDRLQAGDRDIPRIVAAIYRSLDPRLLGAAGLSVLAHLEDLHERGLVLCEGPPLLGARFEPV